MGGASKAADFEDILSAKKTRATKSVRFFRRVEVIWIEAREVHPCMVLPGQSQTTSIAKHRFEHVATCVQSVVAASKGVLDTDISEELGCRRITASVCPEMLKARRDAMLTSAQEDLMRLTGNMEMLADKRGKFFTKIARGFGFPVAFVDSQCSLQVVLKPFNTKK